MGFPHLPNFGQMIDGAVRPLRDQINGIPGQIQGAVNGAVNNLQGQLNHLRDQLQGEVNQAKQAATNDFNKVAGDLHNGLSGLESKLSAEFKKDLQEVESGLSKAFHALEDGVKSEAFKQVVQIALKKAKKYESAVIPESFGINAAFVDISISGLPDRDDDNNTGLDNLIKHLSDCADKTNWQRDHVKDFLLGFLDCGITVTFTVMESVDVPVLGECGIQESWTSKQLKELIEDILDEFGL